MTRVRAIPGCVDAVPDAGLGRDRAVGRGAVPAADKSKIFLCAFGALAGVLFSLLMDVWTVLWMDGRFVLTRYLAAISSALPVTVGYAVSNVIFLLLLAGPIGEKLERIKKKYGLFSYA